MIAFNVNGHRVQAETVDAVVAKIQNLGYALGFAVEARTGSGLSVQICGASGFWAGPNKSRASA